MSRKKAGLARRQLLQAAPLILVKPAWAAEAIVWRARQFHNQPEDSHQHKFLVEMWAAVKQETGGRFETTVFARNGDIQGSDPGALKMLVAGELEFFTLMGGILGQVVPVTEIQGLPFAFTSTAQVYGVMDGEFGNHLRKEMAAKGIYGFPSGALENGFRHISTVEAPIRTADDLAGKKIRVPDGELFRDLFQTLGAQPVTVNIRELYEALKAKRVDAQENPLVITEVNKLYEVTKYVSLTSHMWSGFNLLSNLKYWNGLPSDVQAIISRNVVKYVALQRKYTDDLNDALATSLKDRGMIFNQADVSTFRARLSPFYARWKGNFGTTAWELLEKQIGTKLG